MGLSDETNELPDLPDPGLIYMGLTGNPEHAYSAAQMRDYARAALASRQVPEGWVLVPQKPTIKMMAAAGPAIRACYGLDGQDGNVTDVWAAMLEAAPASPSSPSTGEERPEPDQYQYRHIDGAGRCSPWYNTDAAGYASSKLMPDVFQVRALYTHPASPYADARALLEQTREKIAEAHDTSLDGGHTKARALLLVVMDAIDAYLSTPESAAPATSAEPKGEDALRRAGAAGILPDDDLAMQPTYYVRHPDGSYSIAEPQPSQEQIATQRNVYAQCDQEPNQWRQSYAAFLGEGEQP